MITSLELGIAQRGSEATLSQLAGTPSQIEWAEQIRPQLHAEFDRVSNALLAVARKQSEQDRLDTYYVVAILEEKRVEVLARRETGYFIPDWQQLTGQVRQLIRKDPRYQAMWLAKAERNGPSSQVDPLLLQPTKTGKGDINHEH